MLEQGAIHRNPTTELYGIDFAKMPGAMASLAKELLEQEATGDRARTENWFKKYAVMPPELTAALTKASDIPVDVDPDFDFHPPLQIIMRMRTALEDRLNFGVDGNVRLRKAVDFVIRARGGTESERSG